MRRKIKAGWIILFIILSGGFLFLLGQKEAKEETPKYVPVFDSGFYNSAVEGQEIVITGTVRVVGSEPFPRYVVKEAGKYNWYIPDKEDVKVISGFEQQTLTIKGTVVLREITWADGKKGGTRHILKSLSIVE